MGSEAGIGVVIEIRRALIHELFPPAISTGLFYGVCIKHVKYFYMHMQALILLGIQNENVECMLIIN